MVELVRLYSNPAAGLETLPKLLVRATSVSRSNDRRAARQPQVRLDSHKVKALTQRYRAGASVKELAERFASIA